MNSNSLTYFARTTRHTVSDRPRPVQAGDREDEGTQAYRAPDGAGNARRAPRISATT
jgi:hypothetical protein